MYINFSTGTNIRINTYIFLRARACASSILQNDVPLCQKAHFHNSINSKTQETQMTSLRSWFWKILAQLLLFQFWSDQCSETSKNGTWKSVIFKQTNGSFEFSTSKEENQRPHFRQLASTDKTSMNFVFFPSPQRKIVILLWTNQNENGSLFPTDLNWISLK